MVEAINREDSSLACLVFQFFSAVDSFRLVSALTLGESLQVVFCLIAGSITHLRRRIC